jgi:hypothetical protein
MHRNMYRGSKWNGSTPLTFIATPSSPSLWSYVRILLYPICFGLFWLTYLHRNSCRRATIFCHAHCARGRLVAPAGSQHAVCHGRILVLVHYTPRISRAALSVAHRSLFVSHYALGTSAPDPASGISARLWLEYGAIHGSILFHLNHLTQCLRVEFILLMYMFCM